MRAALIRSLVAALAIPSAISPIVAGALLCADSAHAVTFNLLYDGDADQTLDANDIVGTGTFSYDGPAAAGSFALSSLTGITFDAIVRGTAFSTADIRADSDLTGIVVFSLGGGEFGLAFSGNRSGVVGGSLDLRNDLGILSHEPTVALDDSVGCCGGTGTVNQYITFLGSVSASGDYWAATIPEPSTGLLVIAGLLGLAGWHRAHA